MANKVLRYLGICKEASYGVDPGGAAFHLDIASASLDSPSEPFITYEGGIGRMPARVIPGPYVPAGGAEFPVDITSLAYLLYLLLGSNTTDDSALTPVAAEALPAASGTLVNPKVAQGSVIINDSLAVQVAHDDGFGKLVEDGGSGRSGWVNYASGEYSLTGWVTGDNADYSYGWFEHTIEPVDGNDMPSFTAYLGKDLFEHVFKGCVIGQLDLGVEQELANLTLDIMAKIDAKATLKDIEDLLLTTTCHGERPKAFHDVACKIGDAGGAVSDISAKVRALSLTINNNATTEENIGLNSRFPNEGTAGALDISGSLTLQFESTDYKEDFWGNPTGPTDGDSQLKALEIDIDAGNWGKLVLTMPRVLLNSVNIQPSGREKLMQELSFKALLDCDTLKIITAVVNNLNEWHNI
jgi:hypothetical protein